MTAYADLRPRAPGLRDLALALGVGLLLVVGAGLTLDDPAVTAFAGSEDGLLDSRPRAMLESLPVTVRRVAPLLVFGIVAAAALADQAVDRRLEPLPLAVLVALHALALRRRLLVSVLAATAYAAALVGVATTTRRGLADELLFVGILAVAGTLVLASRQAGGLDRAERAERRATEAVRSARTLSAAAVEADRARIAREMHDRLGHDLSVMVAQAALGRRTGERSPEASGPIFGDIEATGRQALSALRRMLGLLRTDAPDSPPAAPADLGEQIASMVDRVRRAGLEIRVVVQGQPRPLPAGVEREALRVVQESLTNVLRHAGSAGCTVVLTYADDRVDVEVHDDGPHPDRTPIPGSGSGLAGLRDGVATLDGEFDAGPDDVRGFRVRARLPLPGRAG